MVVNFSTTYLKWSGPHSVQKLEFWVSNQTPLFPFQAFWSKSQNHRNFTIKNFTLFVDSLSQEEFVCFKKLLFVRLPLFSTRKVIVLTDGLFGTQDCCLLQLLLLSKPENSAPLSMWTNIKKSLILTFTLPCFETSKLSIWTEITKNPERKNESCYQSKQALNWIWSFEPSIENKLANY